MKDSYASIPDPDLTGTLRGLLNINRFSKARPLKLLIFGYFGMDNIGDDLMLELEIVEIKKLGIPTSISVPSERPDRVKTQYHVESFRNRDLIRFIRTIFNTDAVIFGGGGLIAATKIHGSLKDIVADHIFDIYKCLMLFILPAILRKKIIVFGIGAYTNISQFKKKCYAIALKHAHHISVRDYESYTFLQGLLPNTKIRYEKDIAFLLPAERNEMLERRKIKKKVGLSLITMNDPYIDENTVRAISDLINKYHSEFEFYFYPFFVYPYRNNDLTMAKNIISRLNNKNDLSIVPHNLGAKRFFHDFRRLDYAICTRFHAIVFAYRQKIPFMGISYDNKCKSFLSSIDADWTDIAKLNLSDLSQNLIQAVEVGND